MELKDMKLGQFLLVLRKAKGWKMEELAERAGLSSATVCRLENGKDARLTSLKKIAKALDISISELVKYDV